MMSRVASSLTALWLSAEGQILVAGRGCRHASYNSRIRVGQNKASPDLNPRSTGRKNEFPEDSDIADSEDKLQALIREERRRQRAMKFHRIRKQLTPRGPPERMLSWDAIEQIRYLKKELPEEWTVHRLAEGFSVSTDVIHRVLRSKFIAPPERQAKQDSKVLARTRQQSIPAGAHQGQTRPQLAGGHDAMLPAGPMGPLAGEISHSQRRGPDTAITVPSGVNGSPASLIPPLSQHSLVSIKAPQQPQSEIQATTVQEEEEEEEEEEEAEAEWDGRVLSDQKLEELAEALPEQNSHVVQKGREFFDSEGNFLYRV